MLAHKNGRHISNESLRIHSFNNWDYIKTYICIGSVYQPDRSQNLWLAMQIKIVKNTKCNEAKESHESAKYGRGRVFFLNSSSNPRLTLTEKINRLW